MAAVTPELVAIWIEAAVRGAAGSGRWHAASSTAAALRVAPSLLLPPTAVDEERPGDEVWEAIHEELSLRERARPAAVVERRAGESNAMQQRVHCSGASPQHA